MAGSDIRVKLTAEGVDEVVRALGRVQKQAKTTGAESSKGIGSLTSAFGGLQRILPTIGIAGVTAGLASLARQAIDTGDEIAKLARKTGAGAEALSVLVRAGQTADVTTEQITKGFKGLGAAVYELESGSKEAAGNFRALGLTMKDLKGLKPEDQFLLVSQRLASLPKGMDRATLASKLFGRAGMELLPLMDDLADGGFEKLKTELQALGLVWTTDGALKAEAFNDSVTRVKQASEGLVGQFTGQLIPTLTAFNNLTVKGAEKTGTLAQKLGELANVTLVGLLNQFSPGLGTGLMIDAAVADVETKAKAQELENKSKEDAAAAAAALAAEKAREQAKKVNSALISAEQQRIQALLQVQKSANSLVLAGTENIYKQGLIGLEEYWDAREEVTLRGVDQEVEALQAQKENLKRTILDPDDSGAAIRLRSEIQNIDQQINATLIDRQKIQDELDAGRAEARERMAEQELRVNQQILEAQGKTYQAQMLAIQAQVDELRKAGVSPALIEQLNLLMTRQAEFTRLQKQADQEMNGVGAIQDSIDLEVMAGKLFPFEAARQYNAAILELIPSLELYAMELRAAAITDDDIEKAEQFRLEVDRLKVSVDEGAQQMRQFKEGLEGALRSNLAQFFSSGIDQAESFGDAVRMVLLSVAESVRQIAADMLAQYATEQILELFGNGGGPDPAKAAAAGAAQAGPLMAAGTLMTTAGGALGAGAAAVSASAAALLAAAEMLLVANSTSSAGFASGGLVTGPGTGTSDSIAARLSNGEFVVRAAAVRQPGVLEHLTALNQGMGRPVVRGSREVPRFAEGGLVRTQDAAGQAGIVLGLEDGVIVRKVLGTLRTKEAQRIQIENLGHNQKRARNALGR